MDLVIDCHMIKMADILKLQHLTSQFEKYHDNILEVDVGTNIRRISKDTHKCIYHKKSCERKT
jgi:hypothetical protein